MIYVSMLCVSMLCVSMIYARKVLADVNRADGSPPLPSAHDFVESCCSSLSFTAARPQRSPYCPRCVSGAMESV